MMAEEEKMVMTKILAEKNKTMMMHPATMDSITREWWECARKAI
jgi:hypothetical protein